MLNAKVITACDALAADRAAVWSRAMRAKSVIGAGSLDPFPRCLAALFDLRSDRVGHVASVTVRRDRTEVAAAGGGKGVNHLTVTPVVRGRVSVWAAARRSVDPLPVCRRHQFADIWHASMLLAVLTGRIGKPFLPGVESGFPAITNDLRDCDYCRVPAAKPGAAITHQEMK